MMSRYGFVSQLRPTANARSGLVYALRRAEKLGGFFGLYCSTASAHYSIKEKNQDKEIQ